MKILWDFIGSDNWKLPPAKGFCFIALGPFHRQ
jgi:hypothetical protein